MTLTLGLPEQMFQMEYLLMVENNWANLYWNPSNIVGVMIQTKIWHSSVTLTLGLPKRMMQMAHLHMMENNCVKLFWNPSTIVVVMIWKNMDGRTHTHWRMHIHQTARVTTMSCSPQVGSTKIIVKIVYIWEIVLTHSHTMTHFYAPGKQAF